MATSHAKPSTNWSPGPKPASELLEGVDCDVNVAVSVGAYGLPCFYCSSKSTPLAYVQMSEFRANPLVYIVTCSNDDCKKKGETNIEIVKKAIADAPPPSSKECVIC